METEKSMVEPVTKSEIMGLVSGFDAETDQNAESWNRPRSVEELRAFVARRSFAVGGDLDISE